MLRSFPAILFFLSLLGCSPTFNWREARLADTDLKALLPCKPDHAKRKLPVAGREVELRIMGCTAGDALFAVSVMDMEDVDQLSAVRQQWQASVLSNMKAKSSEPGTQTIKGAGVPPPLSLSAQGERPDASPVMLQAVWFTKGKQLFHAAVYAARLQEQFVGPFFNGLELR